MKNQRPLARLDLKRTNTLKRLLSALLPTLILIGQTGVVMRTMASWNPPEGSVPLPAVLTAEEFGTLDANGSIPLSAMVVGPDGALYGSTINGETSGGGTLFRLETSGTFTKLHDFSNNVINTGGNLSNIGSVSAYDGLLSSSTPLSYQGLVAGPDGALYGTAQFGGTFFGGTLFRIQTDGTFTILHEFGAGGLDGVSPDVALVVGSDGALYGTTARGGLADAGVVFRMETNGTFSLLHEFNGADGSLFNIDYNGQEEYRHSALVVGPDGALYGTTTYGGTFTHGTLFRIQIDGTFTKLHEFNGSDGYGQQAELAVGPAGALYGVTRFGGPTGVGGTLFKLETSGTFTKLHDFNNFEIEPYAALVLGPDGALYGSSSGGPSGVGALFKLRPDGTFATLHVFNGNDGLVPHAALVVGPDGSLYGSTTRGGSGGLGTLFKLETNGTFTKIHDFNGSNGAGPSSALVVGPDSALYGSTLAGGPRNAGVLFKLVLSPPRPAIQNLTPSQAVAGSGDVPVTLNGLYFNADSRVFFGSAEVATTYVDPTQLQVTVPSTVLPSPTDFATVEVTVLSPGGGVSKPTAFTVIGTGVSGAVGQVQSSVASVGETVSVQTPPAAPDSAGVTASLENSTGTTPATVTAATYTENPTPAAAFEAGGGFVDLQVSGADPGDRLNSSFYYPQVVTGGAEAALILKFFNGSAWIDVLSSGGTAPAKNTQDNLDGTVSGGRFQVVFDNTSTPQITELNGTVFAVAIPDTTRPTVTCPNVTVPCNVNLLVPVTYPTPTVSDNIDPAPSVTYSIPSGSRFKVGTTTVTCTATDAAGNTASKTFTVTRAALGFTGFLSPIGGEVAKGTGGTFADPLRAFKLGSTIPVKFTSSCSGSPTATGLHTLQAAKYSNSVDSDPVIDATPTDAATAGNQFRLTDAASGEWHFNLNTKPLSVGTWKLTATLSDGTVHEAWVTIKK